MHPIYPHANLCTNIVSLDCTSSTKQLKNPYIDCTEALEQQSHSKPAENGQILPTYEYNTPLAATTESDCGSSTTVPLDLNFTYARAQKATARNIHANAPE